MTERMKIEKAFILGAGLGRRMQPLTNDMPKPMVAIGGSSLIEHALDQLQRQGVRDVTVNTYYKAEVLHAHLAGRNAPAIHWSDETELLETGGGIKKALANFEGQDFFIMNGDTFCVDGPGHSALQRLEGAWNPDVMDILILLQPLDMMDLTEGVGDYDFVSSREGASEYGPLRRSLNKRGTHMFTSLRINAARVFDDTPAGAFSYLDLLDEAEKRGRLYGLVHDGAWHHISTPGDVERVNRAFDRGEHGVLRKSA